MRWPPNDRDVGESETAGAGGVPEPLSARACGLPLASSAIWTLALRAPCAPGVKVTEIVQCAPAASVAGQSSLSPKSPAFVPAMPMLEIARGAVPVLVSVDVCAGLVELTGREPKSRLVGVRPIAGAVPVPASWTLCGLPAASSVMLTLPARDPVADGVNVTLIVQPVPAASEA